MATTGTTGNDTLVGGVGNDTLYGYTGNDTYQYALGNGLDTVSDTGGSDTFVLSDPANRYVGLDIYRSGTSLVFDFFGAGKLSITGQFATSLSTTTLPATGIEYMTSDDGWGPFTIQNGLTGNSTNDLLVGTSAAESISGGLGNDLIWGGAGNDTLNGGDGDNELHGGAGNDSLLGGSLEDDLYGGLGSDILNGGAGFDSANYDELSNGVFVNLSGQTQAYNNQLIAKNRVFETGTSTTDTLVAVESITCSNFSDYVIFGRMDSNTEAYLGKGNDTVIGGLSPSATVWSSVGYWDDPSGIVVNMSSQALSVSLAGITYNVGRNTVRDGWGGTDTYILSDESLGIYGSHYADYIRGRDDSVSDSIQEWFGGGAGNDTIDGGTGIDGVGYDYDNSDILNGAIVNLSTSSITVSGQSIAAGTAKDNWGDTDTLKNIEDLYGSRLNDYFVGSTGQNSLLGNEGNDTLLGGAGNDWLYGGNGNDLLVGGTGTDHFTGGAGNDKFDFNSFAELGTISTYDVIDDFTQGQDKIDLSTLDANNNSADGNQAFALVNSFTATAGQVRYSSGVVYLNTDADTDAEYVVQLLGTVPASMTATDFIL